MEYEWKIIAETIEIKSEMVFVFCLKSNDHFCTNVIETAYLKKKNNLAQIFFSLFLWWCPPCMLLLFFLGMLFYCVFPNHILNALISEFPIL